MTEIWKDIKGYEGIYIVSTLGRVKRLAKDISELKSKRKRVVTDRYITGHISKKDGYCRITLSKNGKSKCFLLHRIVAETFLENIENKEQVDHINLDKGDNRVENLKWCTPSENQNNPLTKEKRVGENNPMYGRRHTSKTKRKISKKSTMYLLNNHPNKKAVICLTTNETFSSIKAAGEKYKVDNSSIARCCKGMAKSAGIHPESKEKLIWIYLKKS